MKNTNIPFWLRISELKLLSFYGYTSSVINKMIEVDGMNGNLKDYPQQVNYFHDLKELVMTKNPNINWDNKVVVKCQIDNVVIYFGWYDLYLTIGLDVRSDNWIKPIELKN